MIVLDTNIISEIMRPKPDDTVIEWLNQQNSLDLFVNSISIAEISYGLYVLPNGKRKQQLQTRFEQFINNGFQFRILTFDEQAARMYGKVMGEAKRTGHPMSIADGQIAAIALTNDFAVATRNIKDFSYCGVRLVNPFNER